MIPMASTLSLYAGLPRAIYILSIARAIASAGSFIFPMLTLILTQKMGFSVQNTGIIVFLSSVSYIPGSLIGGKLADTFGRKPVMVVAEFIAALALFTCGFFADSPYILPLIFIAFTCLGAFDPAYKAMLTDIATPDIRKAVFSLSYLGHNLGVAVGPLIAGMLFLNHADWMFWGDGLTTFVAIILIVFLVKEGLPQQATDGSDQLEESESGPLWPVLRKRPNLIIFTLAQLFLAFSYAQLFFSLPLYFAELFGDRGPVLYGWTMSINAAFVLVATPFVIAYTKQIHAIYNVAIAGILYAIGFGMIYWIAGFEWFVVSTLIWTTGEILSVTNHEVYIASHSPRSHRGRINSVLPLIVGMSWSLSPILMGQFIGTWGIHYVWPFILVLSLIGAILLTGLGRFEHLFLKKQFKS